MKNMLREMLSKIERLESENAALLAANKDNMNWFEAAIARAEKAEAALAKARSNALEEAAKLCDATEKDWKEIGIYDAGADSARYLANNIRALKEKP